MGLFAKLQLKCAAVFAFTLFLTMLGVHEILFSDIHCEWNIHLYYHNQAVVPFHKALCATNK